MVAPELFPVMVKHPQAFVIMMCIVTGLAVSAFVHINSLMKRIEKLENK